MTKPDTKEIKQQADAAKTYILHPQWRERVIALCNAYDEAQKEIEILAKVVAHYAFLEVNDNGDRNYPANKALTQLGYSEENKFGKVEKL